MAETGRFIWYELATTDPAAAGAFYKAVVGWGTEDMPGGPMPYTLFTVEPGRGVGGMMALPDALKQMGVPPHWLGYILVDDVDASTARAQSLGAALKHGPEDIPTVGRFAVIHDPQGGVVCLFKPIPPPGGVPAPLEPGRAGTIGWHEFYANDGAAALAFYEALLGWKQVEAMDMGEMGTYHIFGLPGAAMPLGGMMTKPANLPMPFWLYYFHVGDIDAAAGRVGAHGGQVMMGPMEVPGGDWIIQGLDPQGALFALVGKKAG